MPRKKRSSRARAEFEARVESFDIDQAIPAASDALIAKRKRQPRAKKKTATSAAAAGDPENQLSPVFRLLAEPSLPELTRENRARLLLQSPARLFFYWSLGSSPYHALETALGNGTSGYRLALRLLDLTNEIEELHPAEAEGSRWFSVTSDTEYRAEIGFYSTSRPFVRILFSNSIRTPRKGPSQHRSSEARWTISTERFVEVLGVSGFSEDAFEVAVGDRFATTKDAFTASAIARHTGIPEHDLRGFRNDELRFAFSSLAAGTPFNDLRWKISADLFALLGSHANKLQSASLQDKFPLNVDDAEQLAFGGSLLNFGRRPRYSPVSSASCAPHKTAN